MTHVHPAFQPKEMRSPRPSLRRLALLGATGSIGRQVCDLVEQHPERFALHAVIAGTDAAALEAVARRHPEAHALLANPAGSHAGRPPGTIAEALTHPRWKMGPKITIDSATMMNKGLEVIEAHFLFDVPYAAIDVIVHPQSVVHSMVEFVDGSVKAQLGVPDMHLPIAVALGFPERLEGVTRAPDLAALGQLSFEPLDAVRYPAVALAREAGERGGTAPAVMNAAHEEAVAHLREG